MSTVDTNRLGKALEAIHELADGFGLDGFPMRYEICPADVLYTFGAYGMPGRFSHWSFGKAFHRMKTQYDYNLSRIYELVINSDPCYAFLLDANSHLQNQVIAAHVLAHSDFFKHNYRFAHTSRSMLETMAIHAGRIRRYEMRYGRDRVEQLLDAALALQEQIDPHGEPRPGPSSPRARTGDERPPSDGPSSPPWRAYEDLWLLDDKYGRGAAGDSGHGRVDTGADGGREGDADIFSSHPEEPRDLLLYIMENARSLADWERDVLGIVRDEMLYFWPQMETKVLNEGWATYWHMRIMREMDLSEDDAVEFARMHAAVLAPSRTRINPYHLGYYLLMDIYRRWETPDASERERFGRPGGRGMEKLFEVRETETDASLLRNYLTKELVEQLDLYIYRREGDEWVIVDKDWRAVRDQLVRQMTNCGIPVITVADGDYRRNGELYLRHRHEGVDLDLRYTERTLPYVWRLWGRPVHLETMMDEKRTVFSYAGEQVVRREIG